MDVTSGKTVPKSTINKNTPKINYAILSYPLPDEEKPSNQEKQENVATVKNNASGKHFPDGNDTDNSSYDVPLPIMKQKHKDKTTDESAEQNGVSCLFGKNNEFDPFADDPFKGTDWPSLQNNNETKSNNLLVDNAVGSSISNDSRRGRGGFAKAHSTEDFLEKECPSKDSKMSNSSSEICNMNEKFPDKNNSIRHALVTRNSWSGPAHSYSNPAYMGTFDPSQLEGMDGEREDLLANANTDEKMQFYEEDFQILEAQGYPREAIKRALIVADNNFAMARKILREFFHSK
jgi:hypothetical protein